MMRTHTLLVRRLGSLIALLLLSLGGACSSASETDPTGDADATPSEIAWTPEVAEADAPPDLVPEWADTADLGPEIELTTPEETGEIDETPFEYPCEPGQREACVTACESAGQRTCLKDWGPCLPPAEFCGNCLDDDCDGLVNEECPPNPLCDAPPVTECPLAVITVAEGTLVGTGTTLHLSGEASSSPNGAIASWAWSVNAPAGALTVFQPSASSPAPSFAVDVAGSYLFALAVVDEADVPGCAPAQVAVTVKPNPPVEPDVGCADGQREGFLDLDAYTHIAGCSGAWSLPGITPDGIAPACDRAGGDDGPRADGQGCSTADLCASGWHVCSTWHEVAQKSPTGCVGATPPNAPSKSHFFAIRQPSENNSVCGEWGDGDNDVFGCGNLGHTLPPDKQCGPLDRALASTQPDTCGYNEAEPNLGPWECHGDSQSHFHEGALVTKEGCAGGSCSYDGVTLYPADKGGVLCCRD